MDFANEDGAAPLSLRLGQPEAGESVRPQVDIAAFAYFGQLHVSGNVGHTEGEGHGPIEDWHESTVREYHGALS